MDDRAPASGPAWPAAGSTWPAPRMPPSTRRSGCCRLSPACDRWDVGGVSADLHPATGRLTVFVYDGHDGGAGFAERGFPAAGDWLRATAQAIESCECSGRLPVLHPVTQVRERQRAAVQAGSSQATQVPARRPDRRLAATTAVTARRREDEATPAGGESGGRRTVRLRGGRAGSVTQESLCGMSQSYQPVRTEVSRSLRSDLLYAAGLRAYPSRVKADPLQLSLIRPRRSPGVPARLHSARRYTPRRISPGDAISGAFGLPGLWMPGRSWADGAESAPRPGVLRWLARRAGPGSAGSGAWTSPSCPAARRGTGARPRLLRAQRRFDHGSAAAPARGIHRC